MPRSGATHDVTPLSSTFRPRLSLANVRHIHSSTLLVQTLLLRFLSSNVHFSLLNTYVQTQKDSNKLQTIIDQPPFMPTSCPGPFNYPLRCDCVFLVIIIFELQFVCGHVLGGR